MRLAFDGRKLLTSCIFAGWCVLSPVANAQPAKRLSPPEIYETHLSPTPVPDGAPTPIAGEGVVRATLDGATLQVDGQFTLKNAKATGARLMRGSGIGIPDAAIPVTDLAASSDGKLHAAVKLARGQQASLRAGGMYVVVLSDKSPAPAGHLWGWLLPVQDKVVPDQPQLGEWYLPQGAGLKAHPTPLTSK